jgi:hypothetical protein
MHLNKQEEVRNELQPITSLRNVKQVSTKLLVLPICCTVIIKSMTENKNVQSNSAENCRSILYFELHLK